jgi:hypothetical protein
MKVGAIRGRHGVSDTYKIALFKAAASLNSATTRYLTANETSGTGYSAGGNTLTGYAATLNAGSGILDFADTSWTGSTFSADGAVLYNNSLASKEAIAVFNFGSTKEVSSGTFTLQMPAAAAGSALVEIT